MKPTKAIILLMVALAALTLMAACSSDEEEATQVPATSPPPATATQVPDAAPSATVIKLGLLSPQTGPLAVYAAGFEDAAAVAITQLNESQSDYVYELIVADSACDGTAAATAAQSLVDAGVDIIVGAACSGATLAAIAVAAPAGIPMVSYASTSPAVTGADDDGHLFRVVPSDAQQAVALAQVVDQSGVSNPAVIYMTNDYGAGLADNFESATPQSVCTQVGYDPTEGSYDAASLAQSVVDGGCDSVVLMSYATDGAAIMEALSAQGFSGTLFGADGLADSNFQNSFSDVSALNGLVATRPRAGAASRAKSSFESAYAAAGGDTEGIYTHEAFDAVNIAAAAVAAGGDLLDALARVGRGYDGASGSHTFDSNGDVLGTGYEVCEFKVSGGSSDFGCPQIWTQDSGLTGELTGSTGGDVIKLGLLSPQTGPLAVYAAGFEDAAAVAIARLNAAQSDFVFELIVADSACDGTAAATAAQSLVDAGVDVIVGAACSGATLGAIAVAAPAGIPMVSYASTSPAVTGADDDGLLFRVVPSDAQQAVALAQVVDNAGVSSPAVIYMTNDYGAGLADNFASATPQSVCTQVGYDPTEGSYDAASLAQSVVDGGCDSVVLMSYATDGAAIMEALAAQGFSGTLFGADGLADSNFQNSFSDVSALDGLIATRPRPGSDSAAKSDFESAYAASGGDTEGIYTHEAYDAVNIAAEAIGVAALLGSDVKAALALVGNDYDGASGSHTFDSNGDVLGTGYEVCEFSVSGGSSDFGCPQIWTADSGLAGK
jgi:branched-chain amino acid transport system substrate-binding protein